jgi:hypothetical protein
MDRILQAEPVPHLCSKTPINIPCHQCINKNVLDGATKLNIQEIYVTRVSVNKQPCIGLSQVFRGERGEKVSALQTVYHFLTRD